MTAITEVSSTDSTPSAQYFAALDATQTCVCGKPVGRSRSVGPFGLALALAAAARRPSGGTFVIPCESSSWIEELGPAIDAARDVDLAITRIEYERNARHGRDFLRVTTAPLTDDHDPYRVESDRLIRPAVNGALKRHANFMGAAGR